jgi:hypothetical protein
MTTHYYIEYRTGNGTTKKRVDQLPKSSLTLSEKLYAEYLPWYMLPSPDFDAIAGIGNDVESYYKHNNIKCEKYHDLSSITKTKQCLYCGNEFTTNVWNKKFCCKKCQRRYRRDFVETKN